MILPIVIYNHPILTQKTTDVTENTPEIQTLITDMLETMVHINAMGLAAPQVNQSLSIFVKTKVTDGEQVFINPVITKFGGVEKIMRGEGCMSIPKIFGDVKRFSKVTVEFLDRDFVKKTKTYKVNDAWIIQHEHEHLLGKLFTEHMQGDKTIAELNKSDLDNVKIGKFKYDLPFDVMLEDGKIVKTNKT